MKPTCPKCKSERWMTNLFVSQDAFVKVAAKWGQPESDFTASMCADCGYTEFYAKDPKAIWEEWNKQGH